MRAINKIFPQVFFIVIIMITNNLYTQDSYQFPHQEHRPYYQLKEYPRGYDRDSMQLVLEELMQRPAISWDKNDSLDYLLTLIAVEDFDAAQDFFNKFRKVNPRNVDEFHLIQFMFSYKRNFAKTFLWLERERKEYPEADPIIALRWRLHEAEDLILRGKWNEDSTIFPELFEAKWRTISKGSEAYFVKTIPLIERLDLALRDETKFEFNSNRALAIAFYEYGKFLEKNLSTTDAFIALSIARYYDKFNADITEKYREIRTLMNKRNFIFPSMRELFPKQNKGIFNIENIKKRRQAEQDSIAQSNEKPIGLDLENYEKGKYLNSKTGSLFVIVGLVLLFLFVAFFVKVKN
jgi:hypothetical protein